MNKILSDLVTGLQLVDPQQYKHITVFPLFSAANHSPDYLTLAEALEQRLLTVKEVSHGGSVPELRVVNKAAKPVLLLDGEEVCGAKQNRMLNTSILVPAGKDVEIPVSCTEQGRWSYASREFADSGNVLHYRTRAAKTGAVSENLAADAGFKSNQGQVWEGIAKMEADLAVPQSATGAMSDVFEAKREDLDEALKAIKLMPDQRGILVLINGEPAGFDYVSLAPAFARLHGKLVKSYVMDALARKPRKSKSHYAPREQAHAFVAEALACEEKQFKSIGLGEDYRGKGARIVGSALIHAEAVIHTAFFRVDAKEQSGRMSQLNRRRNYRVY